MTLSIPIWSVPIAFTFFLWAWGILWPVEPSRGDYDFGPALVGAFRLAICVIGTLAVWLFYFMAKSGGVA